MRIVDIYLTVNNDVARVMETTTGNIVRIPRIIDVNVKEGMLVLTNPEGEISAWAPGTWFNMVTEIKTED